MLRVDCYDFYKLGVQVHPLTLLADSVTLNDAWISLYLAKSELNSFFATFPLKTSRNPATELFQALQEIIPDDFTQVKFTNDDGTPMSCNLWSVKKAANEFETVLKAELNGWDAFNVSQKGAFSSSDLINRAECLLPDEAQQVLSPAALEDVRQAGRCLAFNLGTSAAFHMVRATETFIWKYYEAVVGHLPPVKMRSWGVYAKNLSKCSNADTKVIGWLNQIKSEYRNPVLHPDKAVTPDDALEFVYACISLMMCIVRAMKSLPVPKAFQGALP
jgi:hypothetical protein